MGLNDPFRAAAIWDGRRPNWSKTEVERDKWHAWSARLTPKGGNTTSATCHKEASIKGCHGAMVNSSELRPAKLVRVLWGVIVHAGGDAICQKWRRPHRLPSVWRGPAQFGFHPALFLECRPELDGEVEYDYISLNNTNFTVPAGEAVFTVTDTFNISNRNFSIVEVGMNYKFGW